MVVHGQHRNAELAERRLRELRRIHPKAKVFISDRQNAQGESNPRGQFYTFQIRYPRKNRVYILSVKWKTRRFRGWGETDGHGTVVNRTMDIVIVARDGATDRQILDMANKIPAQDRRTLDKVLDVTMRGNDIIDGNAEISEGQLTSAPQGATVRGFRGI